MATYYPSSSNQRDFLTNPYLSSQQLDYYQESPCPPVNTMYQSQTSNDASFLEFLSQPMLSRVKQDSSLDDEHNLQYQELSLSLGMQIPSSSMELPAAFQYDYKVENSEYLSFGLVGGAHNTTMDHESMNNPESISDTYGLPGVGPKFFNSKYLKPAQELLDEIVNLHEALNQLKVNKHNKFHKVGVDGSEENDLKYKVNGKSSDPHDSTTSSCGELSPSERQDLQSKITRLLSMLDEVDRRYREYYQNLQIAESTLEMVAGRGAAKPYTALALQTISRQFRCLRDAISKQIQVSRQTLGEQDDTLDRVLPRLRNVEKQLRQQRTFQQLGVARHSWRPQRGLPGSSVSILRAWLFEHFLNPYPKYSEKIMLAKQTGLTRSQIANWFINARVRLWKPMVEDMYKEEFRDSEANCRSSPEHHAPKAAKDSPSSSEDRVDGKIGKPTESNSNLINNIEMNAYTEILVDQYRLNNPQLLPDFLV